MKIKQPDKETQMVLTLVLRMSIINIIWNRVPNKGINDEKVQRLLFGCLTHGDMISVITGRKYTLLFQLASQIRQSNES